MSRISLAVLLTLCLLGAAALPAQRIIPVPRQAVQRDGTFRLADGTRLYTNLKGAERRRLSAYLSRSTPFGGRLHPRRDAAADGISLLKLPAADAAFGPEDYRLEADEERVVITAATDAGLFYGLQTLLQLAAPAADGVPAVAATVIEDAPRFAYRGFMIDVSRHFRSKEFLMKQIDALARYKINRLHLHLTDAAGWRIAIPGRPRLMTLAAWRPDSAWKQWWNKPGGRRYCERTAPGAYGGYYTRNDLREVVRYAAERHITVIPEIEMPGHSEEVLAAYPELSCTGRPYTSSDFCVGKEATFTFLEEVLTEVMDIFPSEYIHIGGDEAGKQAWASCPDCRRRMEREGLKDADELQAYLVRRIAGFLHRHGRRLLGWDEILEGGLAPGAAVMSWRGEEGGLRAMRAGHRVVMTPGAYCYLDSYQDAPSTQPEAIGGYLPLAKVYGYDPAAGGGAAAADSLLYGVQANLWAEYIMTDEHYEHMAWPRLLALAETGWSRPERKDFAAFRRSALREVERLRAAGYHPFALDKEVGDRPEAALPVAHLALGKPVRYDAPFSPYYPAGGAAALTDGLRGSWTNNDGRWQGFISRDRLNVTVDLEREEEIRAVSADFMQAAGAEIFLPAEFIVEVSADGEHFTQLVRRTDAVTTVPANRIDTFGWEGEARARYVRCRATADPALRGWIFTDEIVVKGVGEP